MPRRRPRPTWQVADFFALERESEVYLAAVDACLAEPAVARRLGVRPQATAENARAHMFSEANVERATEPSRQAQNRYRTLLEQGERMQARLDYLRDGTHPASVLLCTVTALALLLAPFAPWTTALPLVALPLLTAAAIRQHPVWRMSVGFNLRRWALAPRARLLARRIDWAEAAWSRSLLDDGVRPLVSRVVEALLGKDPDSLLLADSYDGLRSPRNPQYVVESRAARSLAGKITQLEGGGTIAVSGSRGAGKSTLLEACAAEAGVAVVMQAPATYSPYDFLLSLYVRTCEAYLVGHGQVPPEFVRLSPFRRAARTLLPALRRGSLLLAFGAASAALVVLGTAAGIQALVTRYGGAVGGRVTDLGDRFLADPVLGAWRGERIGTALLFALAGVLLWRLRRWSRWEDIRPRAARAVTAGGGLLALGSVVSLFLDNDVQAAWGKFPLGEDPLVFLAGFVLGLVATKFSELQTRRQKQAASVCILGSVVLLFSRPLPQAIATDPDNPVRLAGLLLGVLLYKAATRTPVSPSPLVSACRDELYRLQTMQTASSAITAGPPQLLTAQTTSLSSLPPNFPELVADYRDLLERIAEEQHRQGQRVVIAIDEVDRLGSDTQALAFLSEIKGVLGVPHVHYLISVAEDVGASFVRRGLPHRGVTDSSLDDVVHVPSCTLEESKAILERRAPGLPEPFKVLTHSLSGGVPRDLIRYGLRLDEIATNTGLVELTDVASQLILEELADTLSGFRTLLSKQRWTPRSSTVLVTFRTLVGRLPPPCPCVPAELRSALEQVAFHDLGRQLGEAAAAEVPDEARELMDEVSAYVLFSLTLLDVFGTGDLAHRRSRAAARGPAGDLELLGQARQELEVSPYSARHLITSIRTTWHLPDEHTTGHTTGHVTGHTALPAPRSEDCPRHPRVA
ncbi:hypothetical protein LG634_02700 [Streptomyces bambusae]|uniref:hypothetical protein n=1 Tax=Streptomyces bambusae TaxID=1550616 RepID=UPI001CFF20C3|nr:hypothetical protein [Streptomyces bambusae]MCB5163754.1 hypothetical protein [Streptomyces bambusae]